MSIIIVGGIILIISLILFERYDYIFIQIVITVLVSGLAICLVTIPVSYLVVTSEIQQFNSVRITLEVARKKGMDLENAAIQQKIIDSNKWLAKNQYWNGTLFDIWIPDEVDKLKPIE